MTNPKGSIKQSVVSAASNTKPANDKQAANQSPEKKNTMMSTGKDKLNSTNLGAAAT